MIIQLYSIVDMGALLCCFLCFSFVPLFLAKSKRRTNHHCLFTSLKKISLFYKYKSVVGKRFVLYTRCAFLFSFSILPSDICSIICIIYSFIRYICEKRGEKQNLPTKIGMRHCTQYDITYNNRKTLNKIASYVCR